MMCEYCGYLGHTSHRPELKKRACDDCYSNICEPFDDDEGCSYCDGEGWDENACNCMEGCIACVEPSGMPCQHCRPLTKPEAAAQDGEP
jgi:hypothetical protein